MFTMASALERTLTSLQAGKLRLHIARPVGLFRRKPRSHFHATAEFFLQTGGGTDFECPGETFRLGTWGVCVMPGGVPHAETPLDLKTPYGLLVCMQARDGFLVHQAVANNRREIAASRVEHLASPRGQAAFRYLDEMAGPVPEKHRRDFEKSLLEAFLITVLGELHRPSAGRASRSPLVAEAEKLARALLADPALSVAGLAGSLGCSADYLSRRFQQERGSTLSGWIVRERIAMARDLLTDPRHSISEVGWACGFTTASYFIRVFRQQTNLTPRAWREAAAAGSSPVS